LRLGDTCTWDPKNCGSGNYCGGWTNETCMPEGRLGESCTNGYCAEDFTCGTNGRCSERPFASSSTCKGVPYMP
jgi:hypothetical protein